MKKESVRRASAAIPVGCFGSFQSEDAICRRHCAIRIRCAIERDQGISLEIFEELASAEDHLRTYQ
jgi:hypothetical protein